MILIADTGNGRVTRDESSIMPLIYKELLKTGKFCLQTHTDNIPNDVDLVYLGIMFESMSDINLPCIIECGDTEFFIRSKKAKRLLELGLVKKVITKLPSPVLYEYLQIYGLEDCIEHIPWCIIPVEPNIRKDIDVSFICTISQGYPYHRSREGIYRVLQDMQRRSSYNIVIGSCFDDFYKEILSRSKIFIVEGSNRSAMTYKYFEGANAECLLIGDVPKVPVYAYDLFKPFMIEVEDWTKLPEIIDENINEKRKQIDCRNMVIENFRFNKIVEMYKKVLL